MNFFKRLFTKHVDRKVDSILHDIEVTTDDTARSAKKLRNELKSNGITLVITKAVGKHGH